MPNIDYYVNNVQYLVLHVQMEKILQLHTECVNGTHTYNVDTVLTLDYEGYAHGIHRYVTNVAPRSDINNDNRLTRFNKSYLKLHQDITRKLIPHKHDININDPNKDIPT